MESASQHSVAGMSSLHVLVNLSDRDVEVKAKAENDTSNKNDEDSKGCVLEVGDLDLHGPELDTPADIIVGRWGLEAHVLPVCALNVLKMVCLSQVEFLEVLREDDNGITNEKMGEMSGQPVVHAAVQELLLDRLINNEIGIQILGAQPRVFRDVCRVRGVARLGNPPAVILQGLVEPVSCYDIPTIKNRSTPSRLALQESGHQQLC